MANERDLTAGVQSDITAAVVYPVFFVELDFDSGSLRVWSGIGDKDWDGKTWSGVGELLGLDQVEETQDIRAAGTSVQLTGIDPAFIATALGEDFQGRAHRQWLGTMDAAGTITTDPYLIFEGRMDRMPVSEDGDSASIGVQSESRLVDLTRPRVRRFTDEDQKEQYPNDRGLEFVAKIQDKPLRWGRSGG
jgi:hypothetical protein